MLELDPGLGSIAPDLGSCTHRSDSGTKVQSGTQSLELSLSLSLFYLVHTPPSFFHTHFSFIHICSFFPYFIYVFLFFMYLIFNGSFFGIYQFISQVHLMALKLHTCVGVQLAGSQYFQSDYSVRSYFHWQLTWTICNLMYLDIICDNVEYMEEMSKWNKLKIFQNVYFMLPAYFLSTKVLFLSVARQSQIILVLKQIYIVIAGVSLPLPSVIWWCYEN